MRQTESALDALIGELEQGLIGVPGRMMSGRRSNLSIQNGFLAVE